MEEASDVRPHAGPRDPRPAPEPRTRSDHPGPEPQPRSVTDHPGSEPQPGPGPDHPGPVPERGAVADDPRAGAATHRVLTSGWRAGGALLPPRRPGGEPP